MKKYRLRLGAVTNLWSPHLIEAENEDEAVKKMADRLASKTIDYYRRECWDVEEVSDGEAGEGGQSN